MLRLAEQLFRSPRVQGQPNSDPLRVPRSTVLLLGARFISAEVPPRVAAGQFVALASTAFKMTEGDVASSLIADLPQRRVPFPFAQPAFEKGLFPPG